MESVYKSAKIQSKAVERKKLKVGFHFKIYAKLPLNANSNLPKHMFVRFPDITFNLMQFFCSSLRFTQAFLHFEDQNKWSLVTLDRCLSYTVETVSELSWTDQTLVVL